MRIIEKIKQPFWEEIAQNCPHATFFHTPYWSELMTKTFSHEDMTKGFIFDNGTRAVFPLVREKSPPLRRFLRWDNYISGVAYTYGGPISDKPLSTDQLDELIEYIGSMVKRYHLFIIRENPFTQKIRPSGFEEIEDLSHVFELFRCRNEEDLLKRYHKRVRRYVKKNLKNNTLEIKEADSRDEYKELYRIYLKSTTHWDRLLTDYPFELFQNIYDLKNDYIRLWAVYYENKMIGGEIDLYWNDYCSAFVSYHEREYSKLQARTYMYHRIFLDCLAKGFKYFDFKQSGGIKGVEEFKRRMGGKEYHYSAWVKENNAARRLTTIKKTLTPMMGDSRSKRSAIWPKV